MTLLDTLAGKILTIGFRCERCGTCCRCVSDDSNLVMVSPGEVRSIISSTGLQWNDIAEPYPETIEGKGGISYTFGWCLRRERDCCMFLKDGICGIYAHRPWICRTYPFMLDGDEVTVSPCSGLGKTMSGKEADDLAHNLEKRRNAEEEEGARVRRVLQNCRIPSGVFIVVDSDGVKVLNG